MKILLSVLLAAQLPEYVKIGLIALGVLVAVVTVTNIIIVCAGRKKSAKNAKPAQNAAPVAESAPVAQPIAEKAVVEEAAPAAAEAVEEEQPAEVLDEVTEEVAEEEPVIEQPVEEVVEAEPVIEEVTEEIAEEEQPAEVIEEVAEEVVEEEPVIEQPVEEIVEAEPVIEEVTEEVVEEEQADQSQMITALEEGEVEETDSGAVVHTAEGGYIYLIYNKSFTAKLIQAKDEVRDYYNIIKNHALSYKKVTARISWKHESINRGRDKIARLVFRGKSLYLYLALNPEDFVDTKYKVESAEAKRFEELPCLYRIKNPRRVKYACELIDVIMQRYGIDAVEKEEEDFISAYPYERTLPLIKRGLIKVSKSNRSVEVDQTIEEKIEENLVRTEVRVSEAQELMTDEEAHAQVTQSTRHADKTKKGIINIDVLSAHFKNGETVTLEEIKKRIKNFDRKVTYVKVLARGALNKRLIVEADEFSVDAEKMILLMGGTVLKTIN